MISSAKNPVAEEDPHANDQTDAADVESAVKTGRERAYVLGAITFLLWLLGGFAFLTPK